MKLVVVTQSVRDKASPTGPTLSQQVRSEPACVSVMGGAEPGVARVQAVRLNPEICMVVVDKDNLPPEGRESRRSALNGRQQSPHASWRAREDTTGV
jgi:hypothetical protein